ncbi:hypothetical protein ABIA33_006259 [Streptacidiphilus sp. MAP12-16]|uniref:hypothetical protein n=1 Tax=Streptacidiphilus sp. MAP12-16 TaxID=3156300 RepID=UPI0035148443
MNRTLTLATAVALFTLARCSNSVGSTGDGAASTNRRGGHAMDAAPTCPSVAAAVA